MAKKSNAGRPTVMTKDTIAKLEEAFKCGASDLEACFYADISKDSLYNYQKKHPEFIERKEALKNHLKFVSKNVLSKSINEGNANDAKWYLERRDKDFLPKNKVDNQDLDKDGNPTDKKMVVEFVNAKDTDS